MLPPAPAALGAVVLLRPPETVPGICPLVPVEPTVGAAGMVDWPGGVVLGLAARGIGWPGAVSRDSVIELAGGWPLWTRRMRPSGEPGWVSTGKASSATPSIVPKNCS